MTEQSLSSRVEALESVCAKLLNERQGFEDRIAKLEKQVLPQLSCSSISAQIATTGLVSWEELSGQGFNVTGKAPTNADLYGGEWVKSTPLIPAEREP